MASDLIAPVTGLVGVVVGGLITSRAETQRRRLDARGTALLEFDQVRPLWSLVPQPTAEDFQRLEDTHRHLSRTLLLAGVPIELSEAYRWASRNYLGWVSDTGDMPIEVNHYVFRLHDLVLLYLQHPLRAAIRRRSWTMRRLAKAAGPYAGHAPAV